MIEPNMATTLSFVFTDLKLSKIQLKKLHKDICDQTFNAISIDGDQSPSDSSIFATTSEKKSDIKKSKSDKSENKTRQKKKNNIKKGEKSAWVRHKL